jgi:hypothetical protein
MIILLPLSFVLQVPLIKILIFSWSRVLNHIVIGEEVIGLQMGGKMRDKDRNTIKEKFAVR